MMTSLAAAGYRIRGPLISSRTPLVLARFHVYSSLNTADTTPDSLSNHPPAPTTIKAKLPPYIAPPSIPRTMPLSPYPRRTHRPTPVVDVPMKDASPFTNFVDTSPYDLVSPADTDQMIFGPLELDDPSLLSPSWDPSRDLAYNQPISPILSDNHASPRRASDFDVPDASPSSTFYDSHSFGGFDEPMFDLDDSNLSQWLTDSHASPLDPSSSSPIPIRGTQSDPQSPPPFIPYGSNPFPQNASFSPSDFAALHPLPRSLSPSETDGYLSSPGLGVASISPAETSLRPPAWASQLWDSSHYAPSTTSGPRSPLSENPYTAKGQRFQPRRDANPLGLMFQSSSAPSPNVATLTRAYSRRAESVSVSDDRDATVRRRKKSPPDELPKDSKSPESPPLKSLLKPPKLAPSAWQLYFTDWIQRHQATSTRKLNVAQAAKEAGQEYADLTAEEKEPYKQRSLLLKQTRERENAAYMRTLTPEDIKRENAFRTAQRKAGRSRKSNLKDPNAPKKPLSAYFMFLQRIRSDPLLVMEIFGDEQETTKQSVLAAAKWRSMTDDERKPFLAQAEQEKIEYEAARRLYEEGTTGLGVGTSINFSILSGSPCESPFRALRAIKSEAFSSESESDGVGPDDGVNRYTRL
ncbi:hypothetical protein EV363DRAFT_1313741 [Boletus edulis]|uniref:HMG box domain-containing protein n=1 Tax=Boletus edulis BED1 TaxID=1328754 RepID=A0AAD4C6F2_BOLED|nr:hypothetical protein EV363DRAFT_1313741 [Boletus edulis]KAF8450644.1 hypothetical protein L210DRAFT_3520946 [Boletus edulis BED1]